MAGVQPALFPTVLVEVKRIPCERPMEAGLPAERKSEVGSLRRSSTPRPTIQLKVSTNRVALEHRMRCPPCAQNVCPDGGRRRKTIALERFPLVRRSQVNVTLAIRSNRASCRGRAPVQRQDVKIPSVFLGRTSRKDGVTIFSETIRCLWCL